MKILQILILITLFTGCGLFSKKDSKPVYTSLALRKLACIKTLIQLDVKAIDAAKTCNSIYNRD